MESMQIYQAAKNDAAFKTICEKLWNQKW